MKLNLLLRHLRSKIWWCFFALIVSYSSYYSPVMGARPVWWHCLVLQGSAQCAGWFAWGQIHRNISCKSPLMKSSSLEAQWGATHPFLPTTSQTGTCKHELRHVRLHMQTREERQWTLGLVYFLLDATQLDVHPLVRENTVQTKWEKKKTPPENRNGGSKMWI